MVHMSDCHGKIWWWKLLRNIQKGKKITVKILNIDPKKERVVLGVKQLTDDPFGIKHEVLKRML